MFCEKKTRQRKLYREAVWAHATAMDDMFVTRGQICKADYHLLWNRADDARANAEVARSNFHPHVVDHGYQGPAEPVCAIPPFS
jgi:hypothetical protein